MHKGCVKNMRSNKEIRDELDALMKLIKKFKDDNNEGSTAYLMITQRAKALMWVLYDELLPEVKKTVPRRMILEGDSLLLFGALS